MEKKLEMRDPIIDTYNVYGSITSIINHDICLPWLYNNFIQIRYVHDWNTYFYDNHHLLLDNCPWLDHHSIPRDILIKKWNSIHQFIQESIDMGYYLYFYIDRYHLFLEDFFEKNNVWHEILIYGYNKKKEIYYIADNLFNGKYIKTECTFESIDKGYFNIESTNNFFLNLHLLKVKEESEYKFNLAQVQNLINNYLYSEPSFDLSFKEQTLFGTEAIKSVITRTKIDLLDKQNIVLDRRAFYLFWEHKKLMLERLNYINDQKIIRIEETIYEYSFILKGFESIKNLSLMYNLKKDRALLKRLENLLNEFLEKEHKILGTLIN